MDSSASSWWYPPPMADNVSPLAFPFTRSGYSHELLARSGPWCLVRRTWIEDGNPHLPHFEIVRLHPPRPRTFPNGSVSLGHETYPPPTAWGRDGWSIPTLVHARQLWERLATQHNLPAWSALGIPDDPLGYEAWKEGHLPPATL